MPQPAITRADRCACGYLLVQMGDRLTHVAPADDAAAADRIRAAHQTDDRYAPPPEYRITGAPGS